MTFSIKIKESKIAHFTLLILQNRNRFCEKCRDNQIKNQNYPDFLYKSNNFVTLSEGLSPQQLADYTLDEALNGSKWAKNVLKKPDNPIKIVCKREGITRPQLARKIGVKLTLLENYVSRGTCSAWLIATLREYYNYI